MLTIKYINMTAIILMAVMLIGSGLSGCATKRNVDEIKAEVRDVKQQNERTQQMIVRMDSTIAEGSLANNKMRADIAVTMDALQQQIDMLLENQNELIAQLQQLNMKPSVTHVLRPSPGASDQTPTTVEPTAPAQPVPTQPSIDCQATYDEYFLLARQGEYDQAIEGFTNFLEQCPQHESAADAIYWLGECYYAQEKYVDAVSVFERLLKDHKTSVKASSALYKIGRSQQELGKIKDAKATYQRIIDEYPGSLEASQAKERLKDL